MKNNFKKDPCNHCKEIKDEVAKYKDTEGTIILCIDCFVEQIKKNNTDNTQEEILEIIKDKDPFKEKLCDYIKKVQISQITPKMFGQINNFNKQGYTNEQLYKYLRYFYEVQKGYIDPKYRDTLYWLTWEIKNIDRELKQKKMNINIIKI